MKFDFSVIRGLRSVVHREMPTAASQLFNPVRDWVLCLFITLITAIVLFAYAINDLNNQLSDQAVPSVSSPDAVTFDPNEIATIIEYYRTRAETFISLTGDVVAPAALPQEPVLQPDIETLIVQ